MTQARSGIWFMIAACTIWGLSPLYYKLLSHIPAIEVLAHRTLWSAVFFTLVLTGQGRLPELAGLLGSGRRLIVVAAASLLIACNWYFFIWSVGAGRATEASLGYFIFPLVAVLLGRILFQERLAAAQWLAVLLAVLAVAVLTFGLGVPPWISLLLAVTFGLYGAVKKRISARPVVSVTAEVWVLVPIALCVIAVFGTAEGAGLDRILALGGSSGLSYDEMGLLILSGPLTALPLILFSAATHRVPLATVGLLQYLNPSLQFLCATLILAEPVSQWHAIAFPIIWLALGVYTVSALRQDRAARNLATQSSTDVVVPQSARSEGSAKP